MSIFHSLFNFKEMNRQERRRFFKKNKKVIKETWKEFNDPIEKRIPIRNEK